ncbi:MAG: hypothetical protein RMN51_04120 [Verrucomicrobiota bacterium]|nr:hypothetical protein [Limisphaera sp.]MDW8381282.1 hypothetical protein [Verrucomicrobiota bacterium]
MMVGRPRVALMHRDGWELLRRFSGGWEGLFAAWERATDQRRAGGKVWEFDGVARAV